MKTAIRRASPAVTVLALALLVAALAASVAGAVAYTHESSEEFEAQLKSGQIHEAVVNKRLRTIRITLADGRHVLAQYGRGEEPHVLRELKARHAAVSVLSQTQAKKEQGKRPVHHKLRYIAGGIVLAVVVIVGGVLLYNRRRRGAAEYG